MAGRAFVTGLGLITAAGSGPDEHLHALREARSCCRPLSRLPYPWGPPPLVGEASPAEAPPELPRSHVLAWEATRQAVAGMAEPPQAVVVGVTTGGMNLTEELLARKVSDPARYRLHAAGSVARYLADRLSTTGPSLTVSTACSSGAAALILGLELIRRGRAGTVLVCGADALCRLTLHGFRLLKLLDLRGSRPLDKDREGLTLGEGAAALLLTAGTTPPAGAWAELAGGGLSCDAHHPVAPHPRGFGAAQAMRAALADAGLASPDQVDYLNLHGTGTRDNDLAEALAVREVFGGNPPPLSSSKGIMGHTLGAAGTVEAALTILALKEGLLPASAGLKTPDPALGLDPLQESREAPVAVAMSNSFGFGGNNASLVFTRPDRTGAPERTSRLGGLEVLAWSALSGAGDAAATAERFLAGEPIRGMVPPEVLTRGLDQGILRRTKRTSQMALALATAAVAPGLPRPQAVYHATVLGSQSETQDFLQDLLASGERHASPIDFMGSVHNAPAGRVAMHLAAPGPNLTLTGLDTAFEEAILAACLTSRGQEAPCLVLGAEEFHPRLTPLWHPGAAAGQPLEGGAAFLARPGTTPRGLWVQPCCLNRDQPQSVEEMLEALDGPGRVARDCGLVLAGLPAGELARAAEQLDLFVSLTRLAAPVVNFHDLLGQTPAAGPLAAAMALALLEAGRAEAGLTRGESVDLTGKAILLLNLGRRLSATLFRRVMG
ncbi:MAG: beta-ketoacyl-[acyl-carrier-protein] synthase family protein [Deltaproteobacteria bacterium]|nr:beta-ketoacyl-[acyl-carrier-protein] synthase family protein [Deltaproteobacteria bacterium]